MGLTKTEEFTKTQNDLAAFAKALGHPARIAIVQFLIRTKSCMCGAIVDELPLSQSTVSQHLKELKKVGLIKGDIEGPSVCYCIDEKVWKRARKAIADLFASHHEPSNCC
ncbi:MAG: ArsR/SmtB family transcription factor [Cytophagales bacterium]